MNFAKIFALFSNSETFIGFSCFFSSLAFNFSRPWKLLYSCKIEPKKIFNPNFNNSFRNMSEKKCIKQKTFSNII